MSNFAFINEISSSSSVMQAYIQEFFQCAKKAEEYFYEDAILMRSNVREAAELLCKIYAFQNSWDVKGWEPQGEGLSYYLTENVFVVKPDAQMIKYISYIETNTKSDSLTDEKTKLNLVIYLRKFAVLIYENLGGDSVKDCFLEEFLGKLATKKKSKSTRNRFDPKKTIGSSLKQIEDSLRNQKIQNEAVHTTSKDYVESIKDELKKIQEQMNKLQDKIVYKTTFIDSVDQLGRQVNEKIEQSQMEFERSFKEMQKKLESLETVNSKYSIKLDDINAKFIILMDKLDSIEEKQQEQKNYFYNYAENVNSCIIQLIKGNEKQMEKLSTSAKKMFSDLIQVANEVKWKTECFNQTALEQIKEQQERYEKAEKKRKESKPVTETQVKAPKQETSRVGVNPFLQFLKRWMIGKRNKYQTCIHLLYITFFTFWCVVSYLFLRPELPINNLLAIKICGLGWYFSSWFLYYLGKIGFVLIGFRGFASILVMVIDERKKWKLHLSKVIKSVVFSFVLLFLGAYIWEEFYVRAYYEVGWKNILLCSEASVIQSAIERIFIIWRGIR